LKIGIIGLGRMGKIIREIAPRYNLEVSVIIDPFVEGCVKNISDEAVKLAEVFIDFSHPQSAAASIKRLAENGKKIVSGTTGWYSDLPSLTEVIEANSAALIYSSNFSPGVNLFFSLVENAAKMFAENNEYDVYGLELHHNGKADSPSGTAKELAKIITENIKKKNVPLFDTINRKIEKNEFHLTSVRAGNIPGTHLIGFDSPEDTIELIHTARNREGLAVGAIKSALWLKDKTGIFKFRDVFGEILNG